MKSRILVLTLLLNASTLLAAQEDCIIDLTRPFSRTSLRFPGVSAGSSSGGRIGPKVYSIPIRIRVLQARYDEESRRLMAEVSLQNSGNVAITIPVSCDADVHRDGHRERRILILSLHLKSGQNIALSQVAGVTFGSETAADSLLDLKPGESATIRIALRLTDAEAAALVEPSSEMTLKAGYCEYKTMDERYEISGLTKEVVSAEFRIEHAVQVKPEK